jgi:hypothetical protein
MVRTNPGRSPLALHIAPRIQDDVSITFSVVPAGLFNSACNPGLRPGLSSAVPTGLDFRGDRHHADSKAQVSAGVNGPTLVVP